MAAGGPGDHPLTDIFNYGIEVYGAPIDELLIKLSEYGGDKKVGEFWHSELRNDFDKQYVIKKLEKMLLELTT